MKKGKKLYEGKAKIIFATSDKNVVIQHFKDDATAFNNQKKAYIEGKGILNNRISEHILKSLTEIGIKNHLIKRLNMREQLVELVNIIPIEFIIRNIATGSLTKRLGIEEGTVLDYPLIEYCLKNDALGDPIVSQEHILNFKWLNKIELEQINEQCLRINDFLQGIFRGIGIKLVDFKIEFGKAKSDEKIILADEISPDTCRLWDQETDKKMVFLNAIISKENITDRPKITNKEDIEVLHDNLSIWGNHLQFQDIIRRTKTRYQKSTFNERNSEKKQCNVMLPKRLIDKLDKQAAKQSKSRSKLVLDLLNEAMNKTG